MLSHDTNFMVILKVKWKVKGELTWRAKVWLPILWICALHLTYPSANTHTMNTHPEQWATIYAAALGEQLGVRCLAQGHLSRGIEGGRERCTFTPLIFNSCRSWDSDSQPLGYKSDSLTIRPRLPLFCVHFEALDISADYRKVKDVIILENSPYRLKTYIRDSINATILLLIQAFICDVTDCGNCPNCSGLDINIILI